MFSSKSGSLIIAVPRKLFQAQLLQHDQKIGAEGAFPTEQFKNVVFDFAVGAAHGFLMGKRIVAAVIVVAEEYFGRLASCRRQPAAAGRGRSLRRANSPGYKRCCPERVPSGGAWLTSA